MEQREKELLDIYERFGKDAQGAMDFVRRNVGAGIEPVEFDMTKKDDYTDSQTIVWETDGTIKMVKKQTLGVVPVPDASTEDAIMGIMGVKTGLGTGIIDNAKINLSSRNAEMTIIYDINPNNN